MIKSFINIIKFRFASPNGRAELFKKDGMKIGDNCEVYPGVSFGTEPYLISIGDHVRITANVKFITHDGGVWVIRKLKDRPQIDKFGTITIGNNVMIGSGSIIMPNAKIGNNCIIGAGAVVTGAIPDNSVAAGVPARVISDIDSYYEKNLHRFVDTKGLSPKEKKSYILSNYDKIFGLDK